MANANYLAFARAHFGHARFDFALSGEHSAACLVEPKGEGRAGAVEALRAALADFLGRDVAEVVPCLGTSQAMALAGACLGRAGWPGRAAVPDPGGGGVSSVACSSSSSKRRDIERCSSTFRSISMQLLETESSCCMCL